MERTHFSRVNLVTAEGILVGTHLGSIGGGIVVVYDIQL